MFYRGDHPKIPGPRQGLFGNTVDFQKQPLDFVMRMHQEHGDLVRFNVAFKDWILVANPEWVHDITVKRPELFWKPKLAKRLWRHFIGHGLVASDGAFWKKQAGMVRPGFHRQRIKAYAEIMVDYTHRMMNRWEAGERRDMHEEMTSLTLEIVAKCLFDADVRTDAPTVGEAMETLQHALVEHINLPLPVPKWWPSKTNRRKHKAIGDIEDIVMGIVEERRSSGEDHGDLLSMLVFAEDGDGNRMNDVELRDEAMTLIFAGHETTAGALTWMWYLLGRHPDVVRKLHAELDAVVGDRPITVEDLRQLSYLDMVVKESMRVLPSVWSFMREPVEDVQFGPYSVKKGTYLFICTYVLHHDPRWFPEPERFIPERFTKENARKIPAGAYVPFSAGPRVCMGKSFALMEARLVLGTMVQRMDPAIPWSHRFDLLPQLSLRPRHGMPMDVVFRGEAQRQSA